MKSWSLNDTHAVASLHVCTVASVCLLKDQYESIFCKKVAVGKLTNLHQTCFHRYGGQQQFFFREQCLTITASMGKKRILDVYRAPFPLYSVKVDPKTGLVVTAGGGGASKTGIKNALVSTEELQGESKQGGSISG